MRKPNIRTSALALIAVVFGVMLAGCDDRTAAQTDADKFVKQATAHVITDTAAPDALIPPSAIVTTFQAPQLEETFRGPVTAYTNSNGDWRLPSLGSQYQLNGVCDTPILVEVTTNIEAAGSHDLYSAMVETLASPQGSSQSVTNPTTPSLAGVNTLRDIYGGRWVLAKDGKLIGLVFQDVRTNIIVAISVDPDGLVVTPQRLMALAVTAHANMAHFRAATPTTISTVTSAPASSPQTMSQPATTSTPVTSLPSVPFVPCNE